MRSSFARIVFVVALAFAGDAGAREHCVMTSHGCLALNPDVTVETLNQTICKPGYTRLVRPAASYTNGVKLKLMREKGISADRAGEFELDHIVPLSLGGHPRQLSNLMLQPWDGPEGAKTKDRLEIRLKSEVCRGRLSLTEAQDCIAEDWRGCLEKHKGRSTRRAIGR